MELPIPSKLEKLWNACDLRGCIMLSLFLQAFLVSFAPLRRRSRSTFLVFFLWSAYLLADWVSAVAIGLITQSQTDLCDVDGLNNGELYAFWASFLLLHLGGPDSITSFALEDNEFWLRHFFGLVLQVLGAAYSIFLTLPSNKLGLPTMLVFVVGTIKYGERSYALYLASSDRIGDVSLRAPNPGPDYEESLAASAEPIQVSTQQHDNPSTDEHSELFIVEGRSLKDCSSDETRLLQMARKLFESFKGLMVLGKGLSPECRSSSRKAFLEADPASAFRVVEYELSMLYEVLHTKVAAAHSKRGYAIRFISFLFVVCASILFLLSDKRGFGGFDVGLSYVLLAAATIVDIMSVMQILSSDYVLGSDVLMKLITSSRRCVPSFIYNVKRRRWAGSVFQYDLISYCLADERPKWAYKLAGYVNAKEILNMIKTALFSRSEKVPEYVKQLIFDKLKSLSDAEVTDVEYTSADNFAFLSASRSDHVVPSEITLRRLSQLFRFPAYRLSQLLETFLIFHLATEFYCYNQEGMSTTAGDHHQDQETESSAAHGEQHRTRNDQESEFSGQRVKRTLKFISEYLFYQLLMQPALGLPGLSEPYDKKIFQGAVDKVKRYLHDSKISHRSDAFKKLKRNINSDDLFSKAVKLTHDISLREEELKDLWIMLLIGAILSCTPGVHVQRLSKGGELSTFVWSLANHFGITRSMNNLYVELFDFLFVKFPIAKDN